MRKVSLEMNLGKKSKARFPRRVQSNMKIKLIIPALQAEAKAALNTAITPYGITSRDFCEDFNQNSIDYDAGFLVSLNLFITQTKSYFYEFRSPSCFELFHRCFDFYEGDDLYLNKKLAMLMALNMSLIKNVNNETVFKQTVYSNVKQIFGSLRSYGFFLKKITNKTSKNKYYRSKYHIFNTKFTRKKL